MQGTPNRKERQLNAFGSGIVSGGRKMQFFDSNKTGHIKTGLLEENIHFHVV